jgi:hypothetical protein
LEPAKPLLPLVLLGPPGLSSRALVLEQAPASDTLPTKRRSEAKGFVMTRSDLHAIVKAVPHCCRFEQIFPIGIKIIW